MKDAAKVYDACDRARQLKCCGPGGDPKNLGDGSGLAKPKHVPRTKRAAGLQDGTAGA